MVRFTFSLLGLLICFKLLGQSPQEAPLPEKFKGLEPLIVVDHFPSPVYASKDSNEPNTYFWKHTTTLFSSNEDITVQEGGAYIFYNQQWNLRVTYNQKEFCEFFNISKYVMKAGEPYTFIENWRRDSRLIGGWAMWYVIGDTASGKRVYGIGKLDTAGSLYKTLKN